MKTKASNTIVALSALAAVAAVAWVVNAPAAKSRAFHLFYHSDTRAFYRPCG